MGYDIEISKSTYVRLSIAIFYAQLVNGIFDNFRSIAISSIRDEYDLSHSVVSYIISGLGFIYILYGFVVTWIIQKYKYKISYLIGDFMWVVAIVFLQWSHALWSELLCLVVIWFGFCFQQFSSNSLSTEIYLKDSSRMLSLNQFTFGVGAFLAPQLSSNIIPHFEGGYRTAYGFLLIFVCVAIIYLFLTKFNYKRKLNGEDDKPQLKMSQVLGKGPLWLFTITFSFMTAMYYITVDWSLIYLQDVYGWDPNEKGATYMTIFTACYMVSRLLLGIIGNRLSVYLMYYFCLGLNILFYIFGFTLGENGCFILACSGFCLGPLWPLIICMNMEYWEENAAVATNLMLTLQGIIKELLNLLMGYVNQSIGINNGFKLLLVFCILEVVGIIFIHRINYKKELEREKQRKEKKEDIEMSPVKEKTESPVLPTEEVVVEKSNEGDTKGTPQPNSSITP